MTTDPWERTCKRCGQSFEVGLWCREVIYCDSCRAELDAIAAESSDDRPPKQEELPD